MSVEKPTRSLLKIVRFRIVFHKLVVPAKVGGRHRDRDFHRLYKMPPADRQEENFSRRQYTVNHRDILHYREPIEINMTAVNGSEAVTMILQLRGIPWRNQSYAFATGDLHHKVVGEVVMERCHCPGRAEPKKTFTDARGRQVFWQAGHVKPEFGESFPVAGIIIRSHVEIIGLFACPDHPHIFTE